MTDREPTGSARRTAPTSSSLRMVINELLITDGDQDAFCLDFFPKVQRLFSEGMTRLKKTNLLLAHASHREIYEALQKSSSDALAKLEPMIEWVALSDGKDQSPAAATLQQESAATKNLNPSLTIPGFSISIIEGPDQGKTVALTNTRIVVGRQPGADVYVNDLGASRSVFAMNWDALRKCFTLLDFGSRNGTRVNGDLVIEPRTLRSGDVIEIGDSTKMVFSYQPR